VQRRQHAVPRQLDALLDTAVRRQALPLTRTQRVVTSSMSCLSWHCTWWLFAGCCCLLHSGSGVGCACRERRACFGLCGLCALWCVWKERVGSAVCSGHLGPVMFIILGLRSKGFSGLRLSIRRHVHRETVTMQLLCKLVYARYALQV
jgi:hypothetical protein